MRLIKSLSALILFVTGCLALPAQNTQYLRKISSDEVLKVNQQRSVAPPSQSLRIEEGNVWLNGNLVPHEELPAGLQEMSPTYRLQLSFQGGEELEVTLLGQDYLIRNGRIAAIERPLPALDAPLIEGNDNTAEMQSAYYGNLRESAPVLFQRMATEAELFEDCMRIILDYETADEATRQRLRMQLRSNLDAQFDMSIANMELEVQQLELEIQQIRRDIEYRKSHKNQIIEKRLEEMTGE